MLAVAACTPSAHYDYTHLPAGYQWRAVYNSASHAIVYYGRDPLTKETVYVGPDSRFFVFSHAGAIRPGDLKLHWMPHDAR
ncbi:MAG: hypothetical protein WA814_13895 [Candidatus Baltobacteraceae bacterium]